MSKNELNAYLTLGLIIGLITGWVLVLFAKIDDIHQLTTNIVLVLTILSILVPIVVGATQLFKLSETDLDQIQSSGVDLLKLLGYGLVAFVGAVAFFLVPIIILLMVFKEVDGGQLRDLIYAEMNWVIFLIGLIATIISLYLPIIVKRNQTSSI